MAASAEQHIYGTAPKKCILKIYSLQLYPYTYNLSAVTYLTNHIILVYIIRQMYRTHVVNLTHYTVYIRHRDHGYKTRALGGAAVEVAYPHGVLTINKVGCHT